MKISLLLIGLLVGFTSCNDSKNTTYAKKENTIKITKKTNQDEAYKLMKNNCYVCHNPKSKSHDEIIAPPFKAVKMHYLRAYDSREGFITAVVNWVQNPDEEKALMPGAVNRFKVMPPLPLDTNDLKKIAAYLYDNDVEQPEWMPAHMKEMNSKKGKGMKGFNNE